MTDKQDDELTKRLTEAARREKELKSVTPTALYNQAEMVAAAMATLRKDATTARNNAQLLTQQSNRLKEQAYYWTGVHERLSSVVTFYVNGKIRIGEVKKV